MVFPDRPEEKWERGEHQPRPVAVIGDLPSEIPQRLRPILGNETNHRVVEREAHRAEHAGEREEDHLQATPLPQSLGGVLHLSWSRFLVTAGHSAS